MNINKAVTLILAAAIVACGDESSPGGDPGESETVEVWFTRAEQPVPATREVRGAPLDGALRSLVSGPTAAEREAGMGSWFSEDTSDVLRRIQASDGFVIVDFRDLPQRIPGASSSAGSQQLLASLDSTLFQFPWVDSVEYRLEGSCDAFWEWLQRGCERVRRP
jgi:spore germination protein GerM